MSDPEPPYATLRAVALSLLTPYQRETHPDRADDYLAALRDVFDGFGSTTAARVLTVLVFFAKVRAFYAYDTMRDLLDTLPGQFDDHDERAAAEAFIAEYRSLDRSGIPTLRSGRDAPWVKAAERALLEDVGVPARLIRALTFPLLKPQHPSKR